MVFTVQELDCIGALSFLQSKNWIVLVLFFKVFSHIFQ